MILALLLLVGLSSQTTITFKLSSHSRNCFYAIAKERGEKVAFYFAVQAGGQYDVDFAVGDPSNKVVLAEDASQGGDYVFSALETGEYSFCFSNAKSSTADKTIDMDITLEHETRDSVIPHKSDLEESIGKLKSSSSPPSKDDETERIYDRLAALSESISSHERAQRDLRSREHRAISAVRDLESRLFWVTTITLIVMVGISVGQVFVIQTFFSRGGIAESISGSFSKLTSSASKDRF